MKHPNTYTLPEILQNSVNTYGDKIAYSYTDGSSVTYRQLGDYSRAVSRYLQTHHIQAGDKVALIGENMPNWGVCYYAITQMGAVVVPILVDFSPVEINSVLVHSEAKALIASDKVFSKIDGKLRFDGLRLSMNRLQNASTHEQILVDAYRNAEAMLPNVAESDLACIIYTSGTTGRSKGVMLSHKNLVWDAVMCRTLYPVSDQDVYLSVLPLAHTYECTLSLILGTMQGASVHYIDKPPTANVLMPLLKKIQPTMMLTVPLIIEKIFKIGIKPKLNKSPLTRFFYRIPATRFLLHRVAGKTLKRMFGGNLRFFGIGGAAAAPEVERFLRDARFPYSCGYGLTETSPMICGAPVEKTLYRSVGPAMAGIEYKLIDIRPETGEGEYVVRGPNVMQGYYKDPETTASVLSPDGWFRTGDLGVLDSKGNLTLKGRSKNMILGASGENIYPEEIEAIINEMEGVVESVVYEQKGRLMASVYLNQEEFSKRYQELKSSAHNYQEEVFSKMETYLKELKDRVNQSVSKASQLADVHLRKEPFEKTATQKIKRFLVNKEEDKEETKKGSS